MKSQILDVTNWQQATIDAINSLPENVASSVGYRVVSEGEIVINIAGEPFMEEDGDETHVDCIFVRDAPNGITRCWPLPPSALDDPLLQQTLKKFEEHDKLPQITVEKPTGELQGSYIGRQSVGGFMDLVERAILETLYGGGMLSKDEENNYFADDGTQI